jgi:hypothetical protein
LLLFRTRHLARMESVSMKNMLIGAHIVIQYVVYTYSKRIIYFFIFMVAYFF